MKTTGKVIIEDEQGNCYEGMLHGRLPDSPDSPDRYLLSLGEQLDVESEPPTKKEMDDLKKDLRELICRKFTVEVSPEVLVNCWLCPAIGHYFQWPELVKAETKYDFTKEACSFFKRYYELDDSSPLLDALDDIKNLDRFFKGHEKYKQYKKELKSFSKKMFELEKKYEGYEEYIWDELWDFLDEQIGQKRSR